MKIQTSRQTGVVVLACLFMITQCTPYGFSANKQVVAAAKQNAIPTKKVPVPAQVAAKTATTQTVTAKTSVVQSAAVKAASVPKAPAKTGNALSTTTDFLSKGPALSAPTPVKAAPQTKGSQVISALETKAAKQSMIAQADTAQVISKVTTALTATDPGQKKAVLTQAKEDVKTLAEFARLQVAPKTFRYGTNYASVGSLSLPPGQSPSSAPAPVVILIHGGGFTSQEKDRQSVGGQASYLNSQGYAVFNIDYQLKDIDAALKDTLAAIQWVNNNAEAYNLDANNISLVGFSAGASLGTMVATQNPGLVNGVVAFSPAVNGDPATAPGHPESFAMVAPTYTGPNALDIVSSNTSPTLVFTGAQYDLPGFGDAAIEFGNTLQTNGVNGGTIVVKPVQGYNGTIHGEAMTSNGFESQTLQPTLEFLSSIQR